MVKQSESFGEANGTTNSLESVLVIPLPSWGGLTYCW